MAASTLVALAIGFVRWRAQQRESEPSAIEYLRVRASFYGAIVLAMLFFWEWIWTLNPESESGDAVTSHVIYFPIVDALFVVIALSAGRYLWNAGEEAVGGNGCCSTARLSVATDERFVCS